MAVQLFSIPVLASWIGSFLAAVVGFLAQYISRKLALTLALVATVVALTSAFVLVVNTTLLAIRIALPLELATGISLIIPHNAEECIAAIGATLLARWAYEWQVRFTFAHQL